MISARLLRVVVGTLMAVLAAEPLLVVETGNQRNGVALVAILPVVLGAVALVLPHSPFGLLFGVALIAEYALALSVGDAQVDQVAPLLGFGLLVTIELLDALPAHGRRGRVKVDRGLRQARALRWLVAGAAALAAGAVALAATSASSAGDDAFLRTLGMAAAALAIALPVIVARRHVGSRRARMFPEEDS